MLKEFCLKFRMIDVGVNHIHLSKQCHDHHNLFVLILLVLITVIIIILLVLIIPSLQKKEMMKMVIIMTMIEKMLHNVIKVNIH